MTSKSITRSFIPLLLIFIITNAAFIASKALFTRWGIDTTVLIYGNLVLFGATLLSFFLFTRSMGTKNAQAIVRTVYSGVLSKIMICVLAVAIYVFVAGSNVNKAAIFACM